MHDSLKIIASKSLRYQLFSLAPKLRQIIQAEGDEMSNAFLTWANKQKLTRDWMLHIALLNWLKQQKKWQALIDIEITKELMIAAITRWSLSGLDHVSAKGILLSSKHLPGFAIGLWKSSTPSGICKVVLVKLNKSLADGYGVSYTDGEWDNVKWEKMPDTIRAF